MKRFLFIFLVLILAAGFAAAQDFDWSRIRLTTGLEFGLGNVGKANDKDMSPYLKPMLMCWTSFGALFVRTELDYTLGFTEVLNEDEKKVLPQSLYFDLYLSYFQSIGDSSSLGLILENEFDEIIFSPTSKESNNITGIFTPAVGYSNWGFSNDFGSFYARIGLPVTYIQDIKGADTGVGLDFTLSWRGFGLGIEAIIKNMIAPKDDAGYRELELTVSYSNILFLNLSLNALFPSKVNEKGVTIKPRVDYYFIENLTLYTFVEFAGIGINNGEVIVTPALGVTYRFN